MDTGKERKESPLTEELKADFAVAGSGLAGMVAALKLAGRGKVILVTKGSLFQSNSFVAQGGIACPLGPDDSPALHIEDTLAAGDELCDPAAVRVAVEGARAAVDELVSWGVAFDEERGVPALTREGGHSRRRVLHSGGDATGAHLLEPLARKLRERVTILEHYRVSRLLTHAGRCTGLLAGAANGNRWVHLEAGCVILATGGLGHLYSSSTNPEVTTGDGIGLALSAGAEVADLEFLQFHPTALYEPHGRGRAFLISEALRGEGGILRTLTGRRFMPDYHPLAEVAPRDVVSRAIYTEMRRAGASHLWLDATGLDPAYLKGRFPSIYSYCLERGIDITRDYIPIVPAAHYHMGGIRVDLWGRTRVPGLFACGEVACTGMHGANRLASNALLEAVVFSRRVSEAALEYLETGKWPGASCSEATWEPLPIRKMCSQVPEERLGQWMHQYLGVVRDEDGLRRLISLLEGNRSADEDTFGEHTVNLTLVARLMAEAALRRQESRGCHYRSDYPRREARWRVRQVFSTQGVREERVSCMDCSSRE